MAEEKSKLRLKLERLGTISQVTELLIDFENLYNSLLVFDLFIESLRKIEHQEVDNFEFGLRHLEKYLSRFEKRVESYPEVRFFLIDFFENKFFNRKSATIKYETYKLIRDTEITKLILPEDKLIVTKINIQSPGFWEFMGNCKIIQEIREYLKDRHERKKDNLYPNSQGEIRVELDIMIKKLELLNSLGLNEIEKRELQAKLIIGPFEKINKHLTSGQIYGTE